MVATFCRAKLLQLTIVAQFDPSFIVFLCNKLDMLSFRDTWKSASYSRSVESLINTGYFEEVVPEPCLD